MERSSKVFERKVAHLDFWVISFEIFEPVDSPVLPKNVIRTKKDDVEFFQVAVFCASVQGFTVAHGLVETSALRNFLGVLHLHFDAENRFEEGLGDFLVAEHHRKHKLVGDGELFE